VAVGNVSLRIAGRAFRMAAARPRHVAARTRWPSLEMIISDTSQP
jgi:hypothetical protein